MAEEPEFTLIRAENFEKIMDDANRVIEAVTDMRVSAIACAFAGASFIRGCIDATGGDVEWWLNIIRKGPDAIVAIPLPAGTNTLGKGPAGKQ